MTLPTLIFTYAQFPVDNRIKKFINTDCIVFKVKQITQWLIESKIEDDASSLGTNGHQIRA